MKGYERHQENVASYISHGRSSFSAGILATLFLFKWQIQPHIVQSYKRGASTIFWIKIRSVPGLWKIYTLPDMVTHAFNYICNTEAGRSLWAHGQPVQHRDFQATQGYPVRHSCQRAKGRFHTIQNHFETLVAESGRNITAKAAMENKRY